MDGNISKVSTASGPLGKQKKKGETSTGGSNTGSTVSPPVSKVCKKLGCSENALDTQLD